MKAFLLEMFGSILAHLFTMPVASLFVVGTGVSIALVVVLRSPFLFSASLFVVVVVTTGDMTLHYSLADLALTGPTAFTADRLKKVPRRGYDIFVERSYGDTQGHRDGPAC